MRPVPAPGMDGHGGGAHRGKQRKRSKGEMVSLFTDEYGVRPWAFITGVILAIAAAFGAVFGVLLWTGALSSPRPSALVSGKQSAWVQQGNEWLLVYYLTLANQQQVRVSLATWNSVQPGYSYATYGTSYGSVSAATPVEETQVSDEEPEYEQAYDSDVDSDVGLSDDDTVDDDGF